MVIIWKALQLWQISNHSLFCYKPRIQSFDSPAVLEENVHCTHAGSRDICLWMPRLFSFVFPSNAGHSTAVFHTFENSFSLLRQLNFSTLLVLNSPHVSFIVWRFVILHFLFSFFCFFKVNLLFSSSTNTGQLVQPILLIPLWRHSNKYIK